jgi:hypothetical protein
VNQSTLAGTQLAAAHIADTSMAAGTNPASVQAGGTQKPLTAAARQQGSRGNRRKEQPRQASTADRHSSSPDAPKLSAQFLLNYERRGFCVTKGLLQPDQLQPVKQCVQANIQQQRLQALKHR